MDPAISITAVAPTPLLRGPQDALSQLVRVSVDNPTGPTSARLLADVAGRRVDEALEFVPSGVSTHELFIPALSEPETLIFCLLTQDGRELARLPVAWRPARRWVVHLVQRSHHDVGYTNLPSVVRREHVDFWDSTIDMARSTAGFSQDAQFRVVVEQVWSLLEFLRQAPAERVAAMHDLIRSGHVELTALFGNMVTEVCGHESILRAMYPAFALSRQLQVPILTAEHNDIPGMSWGLCQALTAAGIELLCPALPRYWAWQDPPMRSFWDDEALFPQGQPGCFWWEAPSGKRLLLWDSHKAGGDVSPALPDLAGRLQSLQEGPYPYEVVRWPVGGGARDNAPYIEGFARKVREFNDLWTYPRLVCSTNALFLSDLKPHLPADLPVFRGELPGQDYPTGSTSTAGATAQNRGNHSRLLVSERLATISAAATGYRYQAEDLAAAYEDVQWYDEHTWGHHFPWGPTMQASRAEKLVHAHRAAALTYDVAAKSLAAIADAVRLPHEGFFLLVHNPLPHARTETVRTPMREIDNCGSVMVPTPDGDEPGAGSHLRGVLLGNRWHANPSPHILAGHFDLVDVASGEIVAHQLVEVGSADDPIQDAPERMGLGQGGRRYGFFEGPCGIRFDLCFIARDVPACGWRTYELRPRSDLPRPSRPPASGDCLENEFYRITADPEAGGIVSIWDKEASREMLDGAAEHGFSDLIVRTPFAGEQYSLTDRSVTPGLKGPVCRTLELSGAVHGHPRVRRSICLYPGIRRIDLAVRVLKDATPLLDAHLAFPWQASEPRFRYEGVLSVLRPVEDYLPGAYWDALAVGNWVHLADGDYSILWASLDAPMVYLGGLWPGYVSPAHSCRVADRAEHDPIGLEQITRGHMYSSVFANNFGTNFYASGPGSYLFRYSITTAKGASDALAARFGQEALTPTECIFTDRPREGTLPPVHGSLRLEGDGVVLLACKRAEDGPGHIIRLWNCTQEQAEARIETTFALGTAASLTDAVECGLGGAADAEILHSDERGFGVRIDPGAIATVRTTTSTTTNR